MEQPKKMEQSEKERRLYFVSDIHLELQKDKAASIITIEPQSSDVPCRNFLALCGDIGNPYFPSYEIFLRRHSPLYETIFIITGNHEYYTSRKQKTMGDVENKIREIVATFTNVIFLTTNEPFIVSNGNEADTLFVGCPLWTEVDEIAALCMNDYNRIYTCDNDNGPVYNEARKLNFPGAVKYTLDASGQLRKKWVKANRRLICPMDILQLHGEMLTYIEEMVDLNFENVPLFAGKADEIKKIKKIVVLTHHAPSKQMLGKREDGLGMYGKYYATSLEYLFRPPVVCWISGHTHECLDKSINGVPCLSNCYGYPGQKTGVNKQKYIVF